MVTEIEAVTLKAFGKKCGGCRRTLLLSEFPVLKRGKSAQCRRCHGMRERSEGKIDRMVSGMPAFADELGVSLK